jgi:tetratricopeptide (TPR) repeat protein
MMDELNSGGIFKGSSDKGASDPGSSDPRSFDPGSSDPDQDALPRAFEKLIAERSRGASSASAGLEPQDARAIVPPPESCPDASAWARLLNGSADASEVSALYAHAGACAACAEGLRAESVKATDEEAAELQKLASSSPEWQRDLSSRLAHTPVRVVTMPSRAKEQRPYLPRVYVPRAYLWTGSALAASILIAIAIFVGLRLVNSPERLLAQAYSRARIFDLRIPGADFAEVTPQAHLRGGSTGRESAKLLEARARIERQLEAEPENAHWLELEARADVLEEKFDPAIDILDRLIAAGPVTAGLLVDGASAYFQRGASTGSENDRVTALEYLRHADELAPDDPIVLFNEAVAMEDRGQVINAVETWNRYLRSERDPKWLAEGQRRLNGVEQKLNKLKTHQSRMEQHLATPAAMRSLAANPGALAPIDEELSTILLPSLLDAAFPMADPIDRSRGSPCEERCKAARVLLSALSTSLEQHHHDLWLTQLLPAASFPDPKFIQAVHDLALAIRADTEGDYPVAAKASADAMRAFHLLRNAAGEDRAQIEQSYALMRTSDIPGCYQAAHSMVNRSPQFAWTHIQAVTEDTQCDPTPGIMAADAGYLRAIAEARDRDYRILEFRGRTLLGVHAYEAGDSEAGWRFYMPKIRQFYAGDYPAMRLYALITGPAGLEAKSPRVRSAFLAQREVVAVLEQSPAKNLIPVERFNLASAAIRAGDLSEAQKQVTLAQKELEATGGGEAVKDLLAENEIQMAGVYLDHHDLAAAARSLDHAQAHIAGERDTFHFKRYAIARAELALAEGHPEQGEPLVSSSLLEEEALAGKAGAASVAFAEENRPLYAVLAGLWVAEKRPGADILALWERYRLRILGYPMPACADKSFACLKPQVASALKRMGSGQLLGQVVLFDRVLLYKASADGVVWSEIPIPMDDVLLLPERLERAVSSPGTPMSVVDRAAQRAGSILLTQGNRPQGELLIEPDPLLGNLPWPAVETADGPLGLHANLAELPSLLLDRQLDRQKELAHGLLRSQSAESARSLIVGASIAAGDTERLPEVLREAEAVARFSHDPAVLVGDQASEAQVAARLSTASSIHFAGHAAQLEGETRLLLAPAGANAEAGSGRANAEAGPLPSSPGKDTMPWVDSEFLRKYPPRSARLAVFSACSTGKKEAGWDHGMDDIVGTMAALGVPDVVATRWQIDSASAVPMMDEFYSGLAAGRTVPQALTAARQSLVRDARYRHPYYWAAWYASGDGSEKLDGIFHTSH